MTPDFEEKQYETLSNIEIATKYGGNIFPVGQVAEKLLGFDAAVGFNQKTPIWKLLNAKVPAGAQLANYFATAIRNSSRRPSITLSSRNVSLILQYKRSNYLFHSKAKQARYWRNLPYYRYLLYNHQHKDLIKLERDLGGNALVRYAAPVFHKYTVLEQKYLDQELLLHSNFVSPAAIGRTHTCWTFQDPGGVGYANPSRRGVPSIDGEKFFGSLPDSAGERSTLLQHLVALAAELPELEGLTDEMLGELVAEMPENLDEDDEDNLNRARRIQGLRALLTVANETGQLGASWLVYSQLLTTNP